MQLAWQKAPLALFRRLMCCTEIPCSLPAHPACALCTERHANMPCPEHSRDRRADSSPKWSCSKQPPGEASRLPFALCLSASPIFPEVLDCIGSFLGI